MSISAIIVKDTLSARTGGTKLTLDIARALGESGLDVKLVFFHSDGTENLLSDELKGINLEVFESRKLYKLSQIVQLPIIKLFLKDAFKPEDAINLLDQIRFARHVNRSSRGCDLFISMSLWTGIVSLFLDPSFVEKSALYFHEPPSFGGLPFPVRKILRFYLNRIISKVGLLVSITERMKQAIALDLGIDSSVMNDSFKMKPTQRQKENYVLADTRWTFIRNPFFLIEIAKEVTNVTFVMCGGFGSSDLRGRFLESLSTNNLESRILVHERNTEQVLDGYYSKAKCYIRWSNKQIVETGPSYGLIQAISNGCVPIISGDLGSSVEVINNLGNDFVVQNTPTAFANAIKRLVSDESHLDSAYEKVIKWRNSYLGKEYANRLLSLMNLGGTKKEGGNDKGATSHKGVQ